MARISGGVNSTPSVVKFASFLPNSSGSELLFSVFFSASEDSMDMLSLIQKFLMAGKICAIEKENSNMKAMNFIQDANQRQKVGSN